MCLEKLESVEALSSRLDDVSNVGFKGEVMMKGDAKNFDKLDRLS